MLSLRAIGVVVIMAVRSGFCGNNQLQPHCNEREKGRRKSSSNQKTKDAWERERERERVLGITLS